MYRQREYKGFSLIEILIVVGLILILAAITIVAINPAKHFRDTRNSQRSADVSEILNAVSQFTGEEGRTLNDLGITVDCGPTWADAMTLGAGAGNLNLAAPGLLVPEFIVDIPHDPSGTDDDTLYKICRSEGGRVEVRAREEIAGGGWSADMIVVKR